MFCQMPKEAAKLFDLFLKHKQCLPKLETGDDLEVSVWNSTMHSMYKLRRSNEKIFADVVFFKKV